MSAARIKKGDKVIVLAGKDKGRTGSVLQVMPKDDKVLVDGINVHARHRKPDQANPNGGIDSRRECSASTRPSPRAYPRSIVCTLLPP